MGLFNPERWGIGGTTAGLLQTAFTLWMLIDAFRRGADWFWFWVIFLFQPLGPWVYLVLVVMRDARVPSGLSFGRRAPSLQELHYRVERAPTVVNRLELAQRLMSLRRHAEAIPLLEAILTAESNYGQALHALALCYLAVGEPQRALGPLERLIKHDRRWSGYRAWETLILTHDALGQHEQALAAHREFCQLQPTLEHQCRLAERLLDQGRADEATALLERALEDHHFAPLKARVRDWRWARTARTLLRQADLAPREKTP